MESKIKRFSNFISHIHPKHTSWESKSKSHQNIPMNLWDSNHSKQTLSLPLFLPLIVWDIREKIYPLKLRKMLIMENVNVSIGKMKTERCMKTLSHTYYKQNLTSKHIQISVSKSWQSLTLACALSHIEYIGIGHQKRIFKREEIRGERRREGKERKEKEEILPQSRYVATNPHQNKYL